MKDLKEENLREVVMEAIGEASMCWSETPTGEFQSDKAIEIGERILSKFQAREDELIQAIEGMKRVYEENGNLAANPAKWEISIINYNTGLKDAVAIIKSNKLK